MQGDSDNSSPASVLLLVGVPMLVAGGCAAIAAAFGSTLWQDGLMSGITIAVIGIVATLWMLHCIETSGVTAGPTAFLGGTGMLMLAVVAVSLGLILLLGREPVTVLLSGLATCWSVLILDVALVRRAIRLAPEPHGSDATSSARKQNLPEVST